MTRLSQGKIVRASISRELRLAWVWLPVLGVGSVTTGCFDSPPEYKVADRLPPVISTWGVQPTLTNIVQIDPALGVTFTVPFRSDDAGEDLKAFFIENIPEQLDFTHIIDEQPVPADPRPFAEQTNRYVNEPPWNTAGKTGCSTVTLILSHASNFTRGWLMVDPLDSAQVTWTFEFLDPSGQNPGCQGVAQ